RAPDRRAPRQHDHHRVALRAARRGPLDDRRRVQPRLLHRARRRALPRGRVRRLEPDRGRPLLLPRSPHSARLMDPASLRAIALRQFRRSWVGQVGGALVVLFLAVTALAPVLAPYDPIVADFANVLSPPSRAHPLGTDDIGRDILSRVIHGSRVSLQAGLFTVAVALLVGLPLGLIAGFRGGRLDDLIMRTIEVILSFPTLVLALGITAVLGPRLIHALFAIGIVFVPHFARLIRGQVLTVKENDFVAAARALG